MTESIEPIDLTDYFNIVVLTGAGISVASGLRPFRGPGGLWQEVDPLQYATASALYRDPQAVWRFSAALRETLKTAQPNPAHYALAALESRLAAHQSLTIITQNIDGLHQRAGSGNVIEMHGNVNRTRCTNKRCRLEPFDDFEPQLENPPNCRLCGKPLRLDIVLFEEDIPMPLQRELKRAIRSCNLFIAVGTSGIVYPAAGFVRTAKAYGSRTVLVNLEQIEDNGSEFHESYYGAAEIILPQLLGG